MLGERDIDNLAKLSRITIAEEEKKKLLRELGSILDYVHQLSEVGTSETLNKLSKVRNVLRDDENAHESGEFTSEMIAIAPRQERNYIKVKKILQ